MATIPEPPDSGASQAEKQGWRGFHSGIGLTLGGAPPQAWRGHDAARFLRGWWLAYAHHYGAGAAAFAHWDASAGALQAMSRGAREPQNPWPQFSAMWEAWAAGYEAESCASELDEGALFRCR